MCGKDFQGGTPIADSLGGIPVVISSRHWCCRPACQLYHSNHSKPFKTIVLHTIPTTQNHLPTSSLQGLTFPSFQGSPSSRACGSKRAQPRREASREARTSRDSSWSWKRVRISWRRRDRWLDLLVDLLVVHGGWYGQWLVISGWL